MAFYVKKNIPIEAVKFTNENIPKIKALDTLNQIIEYGDGTLVIETLEGRMTAYSGSWIIKGVHHELYPIRDEIFKETYELVGNRRPE